MPTDYDTQKLLKQLSPEHRQFAQSVASMQIENKVARQQIVDLKAAYDDLWKVMIVILHAQPDNVLRIHESQFLRFKHEYRIDKTWDDETKEVVLRLLTLHDNVTNKEVTK